MAVRGKTIKQQAPIPAMFIDMNDDAFARMVAEEVKNKISPVHKQELMKEENWERWREALIALSENLQRQIENIEADAVSDERRYAALGKTGTRLARESNSYYDTKATRVRRFKFHVDKRLDEVCVMIDTGNVINSDGWDQVEFYRKAIIEHRNLMRQFDLEDTSIDRALWDTLDNQWNFDSVNNDNL